MSADDRMLGLLAEWEEQRQQGRDLTPEQLCPDDPDLREALRGRIRKRLRLPVLMGLTTVATGGCAVSSDCTVDCARALPATRFMGTSSPAMRGPAC